MDEPVTTRNFQRIVIVHCVGELDQATSDHVFDATRHLPHYDTRAVVVDLTCTTFIDCTTLGHLVGLANRCRLVDIGFRLSGPPPTVRYLLDLLLQARDLDYAMTIGDALEQALTITERLFVRERAKGAHGLLRPVERLQR